MRSLYIAIALFISVLVHAQDERHPILSSHDRIDGPLGGEHHVEELQIFATGRVTYVDAGTDAMGGKSARSAYEGSIGSDELHHLLSLLDSREFRKLPSKVPAKMRPIDFFWQKSLEINRPEGTQKIQIDNFYPFLNMHQSAYPATLIELECRLQDIKLETANRPKSEDDWCHALRSSTIATKTNCRENEGNTSIVAGTGWGPVHIGAGAKTIDDFLGKGRLAGKYSEVYFKNYEMKGIQVSFENASNKVHAIYFYNGQRNDNQFQTFCGRTEEGVTWQSSVEEVKKAYGQPSGVYSGKDAGGNWKRLVFAGIDFRFEDEKLVRIGVPGD